MKISPHQPPWPLAALLLGALAARVGLGWDEWGIYWPDEIYQSLEPAHRLVFGNGMVAWEFIDGARNWTLPGMVAALLQACRAMGLEGPASYLRVVRMAFALGGVAATWGAWRLARSLGASAFNAAAGAALVGLTAVPLYFSHRAMSETASAPMVVWGLALAYPAGAIRRQRWAGAALLGLATLVRLHSAVFCAGLLACWLARRRWREAAEVSGVLGLGALAFGLLDRLTWGGWFHSAVKYLEFNLVEKGAEGWGTSPFGYYAETLWRAMPWAWLLLAALALVAARRAPGLAAVAAAFFLLHAWTPHKELRFILPLLPVLAGLSGAGLQVLAGEEAWRRAVPALVLAVSLQSAFHARALTFGELGMYMGSRPPGTSAWDDAGPVNRLLLEASRAEGLCGLKVEAAHLAWTGGVSHLHRAVPLYAHNGPPRGSGLFSHVLTPERAARGEVVARDGALALVKLPGSGCRADPDYSDRLP